MKWKAKVGFHKHTGRRIAVSTKGQYWHENKYVSCPQIDFWRFLNIREGAFYNSTLVKIWGTKLLSFKVPLDQFLKEVTGCDCLQRQGTGPRDWGHLSLSSISSVLKPEEPIRSSGLNICMIQAPDLTQLPSAEPSSLSDLGIILPSPEKEALYIPLYLNTYNCWSLFKEKWRHTEAQVIHAVWKQMRELTSLLGEALACRLQPRRVCPKELVLFPLRKRGAAIFLPLINPEWERWARQILNIAISLPLLSCHFRGAN